MQLIFVMWVQLEFDFESPAKSKRKKVDYDFIYQRLQQGPLTFNQIMEITGLSKTGTAQCITTLLLRYPIWSPARGVYKLCQADDYQTVDWSKLNAE